MGRRSIEELKDIGAQIFGFDSGVGSPPGVFYGSAEGGPGSEGGGYSSLEFSVGVASGGHRSAHAAAINYKPWLERRLLEDIVRSAFFTSL